MHLRWFGGLERALPCALPQRGSVPRALIWRILAAMVDAIRGLNPSNVLRGGRLRSSASWAKEPREWCTPRATKRPTGRSR